ncbi:NADH dehydrogenase [ubiquinone] 1 alpha subcomplex subunit 10, mitochondrial [Polistes fuscatus]|uniref:NADH dehydrogenase [ubiquinone] 1 alpha subcomplex subunit 10, mitochondrial n=1 Tax=Polistes fuscatus TaxID=30207 RepID=UPI001CA83B71|nr:NADH dehydrogenase [ubiquinone] 1 alpha subcomplex subunit 10, mitochondrial [Polistes fuscatus]
MALRACIGKHSLSGLFNRLYKISKTVNGVQVAHISGKLNRIQRIRPPPFPYRKKRYTSFQLFEPTIERYDENSKIIVVEGPIAAGKDKFARELAKELEMGYMPAPSFDLIYKNAYGFDLRSYNPQLPKRLRFIDEKTFLTNPKHPNIAAFQITYYLLKLNAYLESLLHLLSTGEGVVLNRCVYSDFVFMEAMYKSGYINRECRRCYKKIVESTIGNCKRPSLVIYLDIPVDVVKEKIQKRALPYEASSEVLTTKYLTDIETTYKEQYLPNISDHSYLLMYDWTNGGNIEDVIDDIEKIEFEFDIKNPDREKDWTFLNLSDLEEKRQLYDHVNRPYIIAESARLLHEFPEMFHRGEDAERLNDLISSSPGGEYAEGYNPSMGDKVLWKTNFECAPYIPVVISNKDL